MQHNERSGNDDSTLNGDRLQESGVAQMRALLSAFERGIEASGPLMECQEVAELRRGLHASCSNIRDALNGLSDRTLRLERAEKKYLRRTSRSNGSTADGEAAVTGLRPELWQKA